MAMKSDNCAAERSSAFLEHFVREHQERVFRVALRYLGSIEDAQDLTQDVLLTLSRKIHQFEGQARLSTWVYRITVNHAKNRLRYLSRRRMRAHEPYEEWHCASSAPRGPQTFAGPHEILCGRELSLRIDDALDDLSPIHRQILVWRDLDGLSYETIAQRLDLPKGTVKSRLHRARTRLKGLVHDDEAPSVIGVGANRAQRGNPKRSAAER